MLKLKYAIPLLALLMSVAIIAYQYVTLSHDLKERELQFGEKLLANMADMLQDTVNEHFQADSLSDVQRDISLVAMFRSVKGVYLIAEDDRILVSDNFTHVGMPFARYVEGLSPDSVQAIRGGLTGQVMRADGGATLNAVYPVTMKRASGSFYAAQTGVVVIAFDMRKNFLEVEASVFQATLESALFVGVILLMGVLLVRQFFTRRVERIVGTALAYINGEQGIRSSVGGADELGDISRAFNRAADAAEQAKSDLQRKERLLSNAQRIAGLGSWTWDMETGEDVWSDEMFKVLGYEVGEIKPGYQAVMERLHPDDREMAAQNVNEANETGQGFFFQHRIIHPNGEERFVISQSEFVEKDDHGGRVMQGTMLDITDRYRAEQEIKRFNERLEQRVADRTQELSNEIQERKAVEQKLRDNESKFRSLVGNIPGIIYRCKFDKDWTMNFISDAVEDITGYPASDFIGNTARTFDSVIHPKDRQHVAEEVNKAVASGEPYRMEYRLVHANGEVRYVSESGRCVCNETQEEVWLDGAIFDVTDLQAAKRKVLESEERTRLIVNSAVDGIITIDDKGTIITFNSAAEQIFGYSVIEAVGQNVKVLMNRENAQLHDGYLQQYLETGKSNILGIGRELIARRKDGTHILIELSVSEFKYGGKVTFVGIARDITARKEAEYQLNTAMSELQASKAEIEQSERRLHDILDSSTSGISVLRTDPFERAYVNNRLLELFGADSMEHLASVDIADTFANPEDAERAKQYLNTGQGYERFVMKRTRLDGSQWWALQDASPIEFEGQPAFIIWHYDISDQKAAEDSLIESEKMASLGALVAGVAHEVNTPIGVGVTAVSHLKDVAKTFAKTFASGSITKSQLADFVETVSASSDMINANLNRASDLIRSFKQVAVDQSSEEARDINLLDYIDEVLLSLQPKLKRTRHEIKVDGDRDIRLNTQPGAVSQVITNLVMNSVIHAYDAQQAGHIHISARKNGVGVKLEYSDDGKGMDEDVRAKIFDPFFTTKRGAGGSGLGMHILYNQITQTLGGSVVCDSKPGGGTSFTITIPQHVGDPQ